MIRSAPPELFQDVIARDDLLQLLDRGLVARATLLVAPAGYGKTIVGRQWFAQLRRRGHACLWVTCDEPASEECGDAPLAVHLAAQFTDGGVAKKVVFFDDACRASAAMIGQIETLLQDPDLHVVLMTRRPPQLKLAKMIANGEVREIRAGMLRFTDEQARALLGPTPCSRELQPLLDLAEGWPVMLQFLRLAAIDLGEGQLVANHLDAVRAYVQEQLVDGLSPAERSILEDASVLGRFTATLLDNVRGTGDTQATLVGLRHLHPLLRLLAEKNTVYELHPLLRKILYEARLAAAPQSVRDMHERAAIWLTDAEQLPDAIPHFIAAGQTQRAAELIQTTGAQTIIKRWSVAGLCELLELLPPATARTFPQVRFGQILTLLNKRDFAEAELQFDRLRQDLAQQGADAPENEWHAFQTMIEVRKRMQRDEFPTEEELGRLRDQMHRSVGYCTTAIFWHQQRGAFLHAERDIPIPGDDILSSGAGSIAAYLVTYRGMIAFARGELDRAHALYQEAAAARPQSLLGHSYKLLAVEALRAELLYERDEIEAASDLIAAHAREHRGYDHLLDVDLAEIGTRARLARRRGSLLEATSILEKGVATAERAELSIRANALRATMIEMLLQAQQIDRALDCARTIHFELTERNADRLPWRVQDAMVSAKVRLTLVEGHAEAALADLAHIEERWKEAGLVRGIIRVNLLRALALEELGRVHDAINALAHALYHGFYTGHFRVLVDEQQGLAPLLLHFIEHMRRRNESADLLRFAERLLSAIDAERQRIAIGDTLLSPRERDILLELSRGKTNKMIARSYNIAENTVKHHVRQIYGKLSVQSRVQAVQEARRRTLIP